MGQEGLAVVMSGGGARAAYQVGFLRAVAARFPELEIEILTGVSAGAINAAYMAGHGGSFAQRVEGLEAVWRGLFVERVIEARSLSLGWTALRWLGRLGSGGLIRPRQLHGLVETEPLRALLGDVLGARDGAIPGIGEQIGRGELKAVAITATSYSTGQSVTFVQGREIEDWRRPNRRSEQCALGVEHVMASASLPLLFPAIELADGWYGDGGVRLAAPLAPAVHLGAKRILAISTRTRRPFEEEDRPSIDGYPPPAQVAGILLNAVFLDLFDNDALRLERINDLVGKLPEEERSGLRPIGLQVWRPSQDLGRMANEFEAELPRALRFLTRGTGTQETRSNDFLSLIMFQADYTSRLIDLGVSDAEANMDSIAAFLEA